MATQLYNVVYSGKIHRGKSREEVIKNLAELMKTDVSNTEKLFSGGKFLIKANVQQQIAQKYIVALNRAGAIATTELASSSEASAAGQKKSGKSKTLMFLLVAIIILAAGYFVVMEYVLKPDTTAATDSTILAGGTVELAGDNEDYVSKVLNNVDELLTISKVGLVDADSCQQEIAVGQNDALSSCQELSGYYQKDSSYRKLLSGLPEVDQKRFGEAATSQQTEQFNRESDEVFNNADEMLKAMNAYTDYLQQSAKN